MVGVGGDAGDDVGIARLHRARRAAQAHHARGAAGRHMVEPARRQAQVLGHADRGVGREREAAQAQAVDLRLRQAAGLHQRLERLADEPVGAVRRVAHVGHGDRHGHRDAFVGQSLAAHISPASSSWRACRRSGLARAGSARVRATAPRWIFCEAVSGRSLDERHVAGGLVVGQLRRAHARRCLRQFRARSCPAMASRVTMQASTSSPRTASGVAATADAFTAGCWLQHALHLHRRDVLAAAADHVLLAVDEEEVALGIAPHQVAGVEPAAGPGLARGRLVLQVAGEEMAARIVASGAHQQFARRVDRARRGPRRRPAAISTKSGWRPKQLLPTQRGSRFAITQAAAPVSVMAQASTSGKPKRSSKGAWFLRSTPAPKPQRIAWSRSAGRGRCSEQHRRHHAEVVHDRGAAFACAAQPALRMKAVELHQAAARNQHHHGRERHRVHVIERQRRDDALGVAAGCCTRRRARRTTRRRAGSTRCPACSPWAGRWCRRCRAGAFGARRRSARPRAAPRCCARGTALVAIGCHRSSKATPASLAAALQVGRARGQRDGQADLAVPDQVVSSAERISALIGTTLTPSALSANQWNKKAGRFSSSRPTRWPWP